MRGERDHERMWKGPRLAREIFEAVHLDADFLAHLAVDAILDGLARLDEARERAVHRAREARRAREQDLAAADHQRHHRRRHPWIGNESAGGTLARALARPIEQRCRV